MRRNWVLAFAKIAFRKRVHREIDQLDGQVEFKQETINRLSAEIDWIKYLERSKEEIAESQAVYAEKAGSKPSKVWKRAFVLQIVTFI